MPNSVVYNQRLQSGRRRPAAAAASEAEINDGRLSLRGTPIQPSVDIYDQRHQTQISSVLQTA
jgi:hypothetical protein